jgi:RNA-directed DNA polymerase
MRAQRQNNQEDLFAEEEVRSATASAPGEARSDADGGVEALMVESASEAPTASEHLMEVICSEENIEAAMRRVEANNGSAGIDAMTSRQLRREMGRRWGGLREQLLRGVYRPKPVRRVMIEKAGGGERELGIPTAIDRMIQQAILQVVQPHWDQQFHVHSYGYRPGRSAHQAVEQAHATIEAGYEYVVDIDLEKFFDRVNHDVLMSRVARQISDKRVLKLIRGYLEAGVMIGGVSSPRREGTPQGGPLSPLLSNLLLNELDEELQRRGHSFVRYADDCMIYVKSQRSGERVLASVEKFLWKRLRLRVNRAKSAVAAAWSRSFLGFSFVRGGSGVLRVVAKESKKRFRRKVRELGKRGRTIKRTIQELGRYLRGWRGYFGASQSRSELRDLDSWIRRRLRNEQWKRWKTGKRRYAELRRGGAKHSEAAGFVWRARGSWRVSRLPLLSRVLSVRYFDEMGLVRLAPSSP